MKQYEAAAVVLDYLAAVMPDAPEKDVELVLCAALRIQRQRIAGQAPESFPPLSPAESRVARASLKDLHVTHDGRIAGAKVDAEPKAPAEPEEKPISLRSYRKKQYAVRKNKRMKRKGSE